MTTFHQFLQSQIQQGGFATEDVLVSFLPLVQQVIVTHDYGEVAPLEGLAGLQVENRRIWYADSDQLPQRRNLKAVQKLLQPASAGFNIVAESDFTFDVDEGLERTQSRAVADAAEGPARAAFVPGYVCWEHMAGHHDPVTDVFSLGLILVSLACGLDLADPDDHARFVSCRKNLFRVNPAIHPVIARTVVVMTELDRHKRPPDLRALLMTLENYRDQEVDFETDLASDRPIADASGSDKRKLILSKLRERLFEINRRNRLLHFRTTMQTVNLTQASIPLSFDVNSIRKDQVLTWNGSFCDAIVRQKVVLLNKHLDFREAVYLPGTLDRIRAEARKDQNDYGFAQLRLIIAFLRWADVKAQPPERYESPLLLLPVKLDVKKGIHDRYTVQAVDSAAEVNPVVRHLFRQLYDIDLPDHVELSGNGLDTFFEYLRTAVHDGDAAVELKKVDQPRIEVIHEKARRRLDQYRRRTRLAGRGIRHFMDLDYSYDPVNYHPLGVRIFEHFIAPGETHLERVIAASAGANEASAMQVSAPVVSTADGIEAGDTAPAVVEAEGHFYRLLDEVDDNPLNWELDFCSVTLANLKYRRMSLAQDYNHLIAHSVPNPPFEAAFAIDSPEHTTEPVAALPLSERFHILPCDPTQGTATTQARCGRSYIIQGPPGTGKSQTIANLIADFVNRGKRILFVCESGAAVDVVYHRLKQQGLQDLCCLIHDSQADKKQFVTDLKRTFDDFLAEANQTRDGHLTQRHDTVSQVNTALLPIAAFNDAMKTVPDVAGIPVRSLLDQLLKLRGLIPDLIPREWERVPAYVEVNTHRRQLQLFEQRLRRIRPDGILAAHPLRLLSTYVVDAERPVELVTECLESGRTLLRDVVAAVQKLEVPSEVVSSIAQLATATMYARDAGFLAERELLQLLDPDSDQARSFARRIRKLDKCDRQVTAVRDRTCHWRNKLSSQETQIALAQARQMEGRWLSLLRPGWWRLRRTLNAGYDFSQHAVKPGWTLILQQLDEEHEKLAERYKVARDIGDEFDIDLDLDGFLHDLQGLRECLESQPGPIQSLNRYVLSDEAGGKTLRALAAVHEPLSEFCRTADRFLEAYEFCSPEELLTVFDQLSDSVHNLPDWLHCLESLRPLPGKLTDAVRTLPLTLEELEAAAAEYSLRQLYRDDPELARFDGAARTEFLNQLVTAGDRWLADNAAAVRESVRQRFCDSVVISSTPAAQLTQEQKEFKKRFSRGRRELQHEFGKSMRYKSIRELADGDSGLVIRDLKPVWLMSPLSVSDTLPLSADHFDAVIFDEASQITLEDAVPALFRADQAIVVGDEMQLPPTSFFATRRADDEDLEFEEEGETVHYDLNSSSLLNHGSRNLPSQMLGWHYRSRSESLISFSNHAFYGGRLLTVPEETLPLAELPELLVSAPAQGTAFAAAVVARPVSFHFMENGVYEKRRNTMEAEYIAQLVRQLVQQDQHYSVGIVAFSEAQQSEIERALRNLADDDADFAEAYEAELEREDDGQFAGLLVRNLENIQGDERDVIIMSVCYGPDPHGKIRMNFGPINMAGGEKRLNVAFSRAKQFMALVASMRSTAITNEYNDGANCLKKYLRYAEACSVGQTESVGAVLRSLSGHEAVPADNAASADQLTGEIAEALRNSGYQVDLNVGQSHFRVDLAVRREGDAKYRLGILTDNARWYQQTDLLERELLKPRLLTAFGWQVTVVLARDWYHEKDRCLKSICAALETQ